MKYGSRFRKAFEAARETVEYWMEHVRLDFTQEITEAIKSKNISQKDIAARMGKSEAYISKIMNSNSTNFTLKTMVQLCLALGSRITIKIEDIEPVSSHSHVEWDCLETNVQDFSTFTQTTEFAESKREEGCEVGKGANKDFAIAA